MKTEDVLRATREAYNTFSRAVHGMNARSMVLCDAHTAPAEIVMLQALVAYLRLDLKVVRVTDDLDAQNDVAALQRLASTASSTAAALEELSDSMSK